MVPGVTDVALLVPCMFGSRNRILPWLRTGGGGGRGRITAVSALPESELLPSWVRERHKGHTHHQDSTKALVRTTQQHV
jgi:hypothetical protein